jgi:hypothetical protein
VGGKAETSQYQYYGNLPRGMTPSEARAAGTFGTTGVFPERGGIPGLSTTGAKPVTMPTEAGGKGGLPLDESGRPYIPHDAFQIITGGRGAEGRTNMAYLAELAAQNYGIARVEAEDGTIQNIRVYNRGGGDIRYAPVSIGRGETRSAPYKHAPKKWKGGGGVESKEQARWKKQKHAYRDAKAAERDAASLDAIGEGTEEPSAEDFKAWFDRVTGYYGEDIWNEAKIGAGSGLTGRASIEYTAYAKGAFDRYSQLEQSDTKLGFYEWFQESQHIFGSAAWDNAMDKTVGGDYRTDKAKTAYEAYLGYEPDWEVEEPEFGGAASAPRYQAGGYFDYDTRGGAVPMTRRKARPGYLGLINWRI